jgi:hypothetical protein
LLDALRRGHSKRRPPSKGTVAKQYLHEQHRNPEHREFPAGHFESRAKPNQIKLLVAKIESLGYDVEIKPLAA